METIKQFALETGRLVVVALVSYLATDLVLGNLVSAFGGFLAPEIKIQITGLLTIVVKAIDRALHESVDEKGLLRF